MTPATGDDGWWEPHESVLRGFSNNIEVCVANSDWDQLISVLRLRQAYLEEISAKPVPEEVVKDLRGLVTEILEQDATLQLKVQDQKGALTRQLAELKRSQSALQAYNDQ